MASEDLSLWDIESPLIDLVATSTDATLDEADRAEIDQQIAVYLKAEVSKVDGIRGIIKHWEMIATTATEESKRQKARADRAQQNIERLKSVTMDTMVEIGKRRIEGKTGTLRIQPNGGKLPVIITDLSLLPDEYVWWEGRISGRAIATLIRVCALGAKWLGREDVNLEPRPLLNAIHAALNEPCPACEGTGEAPEDPREPNAKPEKCSICDGRAFASVPGAHLGERGESLRVE